MENTQSTAPLKALQRLASDKCPGLPLEEGVRLSECTTLRLGGPATLFYEMRSEAELQWLLRAAGRLGAGITVIGHGSNLLVLDGGIDGLVIRVGREWSGLTAEGSTLTAQAGAMLSSAAQFAARHALAGLSFAAGIPGTVGGGCVMNAGAYGGEMSQAVRRVRGYTLDGEPFAFTGSEMEYGYRHSRLLGVPCVVTEVTLELTAGDTAALTEEMAELNRRRREKQPLDTPSAGSTFKRPAGGYAAALIDQCGLKGCRVGGAQVSEKHAGFLLNTGGTAEDFLQLMQLVQRTVQEKTGVLLEPEVRILGKA